MSNAQLLDWIQRNKGKGYSHEQLKKYLVSYGYKESDIESALRETEGKNIVKSAASPKKPIMLQSPKTVSLKTQSTTKPKIGVFWNHVRYRNLLYLIVITALTLGVYWFYWFWRTSREIEMVTGKSPRKGFLIPSVAIAPIVALTAAMLFTASLIDTKGSRLFLEWGSLAFVGVLLVFLLFIGTFFWSFAMLIESIIKMPAWIIFIMLITIAPSIIVMLLTQAQLNMYALQAESSGVFLRRQAYLQRETAK